MFIIILGGEGWAVYVCTYFGHYANSLELMAGCVMCFSIEGRIFCFDGGGV